MVAAAAGAWWLHGACRITPRLSVKAVYYLSDVSESCAPTWVVPGSHLQTMDEFNATLPPSGRGQPAGAVPVLAKAGDVLLFDRRLRHAASPNWSAQTRKGFFIGYSCALRSLWFVVCGFGEMIARGV